MSKAVPHILPPPREVRMLAGSFSARSCHRVLVASANAQSLDTAQCVAATIGQLRGVSPEVAVGKKGCPGDVVLKVARQGSAESYRVQISKTGVELTGGGQSGLFYSAQTFDQIAAQSDNGRLPCLSIEDSPDFKVRGFYHDISRGKVPTRETLFGLIEKLAHYKINQLQLYIEHTYAFKNHPDIWAGSDPLTEDDVRALDEYAARNHVDLVPSLSTFGHFYTALVSPRKHHLNELPIDASQIPFSWWDRMGHYTLDCLNPESLDLVCEMIRELRPLFRSKLFNICCDETFDLGKGRNAGAAASLGAGRLYVDFLKRIMKCVVDEGATPMYWGDIIGRHPELVREIPSQAIALDWDYSSDLRDTQSGLFKKAKRPFYVCPGVSGWDRWINDFDTATSNIISFVARGRRTGAIGVLNTDWGDRGHVNCLGNSYHGAVLGASAAWNSRATEPESFDLAFSRLECGDASGKSVMLMREASLQSVVSWRLFTLWLDPTPHRSRDEWDSKTDVPVDLLKIDARRAFSAANRIDRIAKSLRRVISVESVADPTALSEILIGCRGQALMNRLGGWVCCLARRKAPPRGAPSAGEVANEIRRFENDLAGVWHERNRPSDYWRLRSALLELARRLDLAALRGVWVHTPRLPPPPSLR